MKLRTLSIVSVARFLIPYAIIWSFASGKTSMSQGIGRFPHCTYGFGCGKHSCFLKTCSNLQLSWNTLPGRGQHYSNDCKLLCNSHARSNRSFLSVPIGRHSREIRHAARSQIYRPLCNSSLHLVSWHCFSSYLLSHARSVRVWLSTRPLSQHFVRAALLYCYHLRVPIWSWVSDMRKKLDLYDIFSRFLHVKSRYKLRTW